MKKETDLTASQERFLRKQKKDVERFIAENGREPVSLDFDTEKYMTSSRSIQRRLGGLVNLRNLLGLEVKDFTKGSERVKKAKVSMDDCQKDESDLFKQLLSVYTQKNVSSPTKVFLYRGVTADLRLDHEGVTYLIDIFKPNSKPSFLSCVRIKNKKYLQEGESFYIKPVQFLYVCMNEEVMVQMDNPIPILSITEFKKRFLNDN